MYTLNKSGITGQNWKMAKKLNEEIEAKVRTKHGLTRTIKIRDSIRQGGILSVIEYGNMMDEITKEIRMDETNNIEKAKQTQRDASCGWTMLY